MNEWITVTEAVKLTNKAESTIRRFTTEHKKNKSAVKLQNGKMYINKEFLSGFYSVVNDHQKTTANMEAKHKKEAMQIAYNSEIVKAKDNHIKEKDKQLEMLIKKKSYAWVYLTIGFVILIAFLCVLGRLYRAELLDNHQLEVICLSSSFKTEVKLKDEIIKTKENTIQEIKSELKETRTAYQQTLKSIDFLHTKYTDKIEEKEKKYNKELEEERAKTAILTSKITHLTKTDTYKI